MEHVDFGDRPGSSVARDSIKFAGCHVHPPDAECARCGHGRPGPEQPVLANFESVARMVSGHPEDYFLSPPLVCDECDTYMIPTILCHKGRRVHFCPICDSFQVVVAAKSVKGHSGPDGGRYWEKGEAGVRCSACGLFSKGRRG